MAAFAIGGLGHGNPLQLITSVLGGGGPRIEIIGQEDCSTSAFEVQTMMPEAISSQMSSSEWHSFRETLQVALAPIGANRRQRMLATKLGFGVFIVGFVLFAVSGFTMASGSSGFSPMWTWCICFFAIVFLAVSNTTLMSQYRTLLNPLRAALAEASSRHSGSGLSFNLREDIIFHGRRHRQQKLFIEVSVSSGSGAAQGPGFGACGFPVATATAVPAPVVMAEAVAVPTGIPAVPEANFGGGPAEALKQLEGLHSSGLVTEAEYQAKRAEILSRI